MKQNSLYDLGGVLKKKISNIDLVKFKYRNGVLVELKALCTDDTLYPFDFNSKNVNQKRLEEFLFDRLTPPTRQGLHEDLILAGIPYYDPEAIIRYSSGRCIHDSYWIECDNDMTYKERLNER
jgi:hypothetical protein